MSKDNLNFEDSIKELENIVLKLEKGECSLDESIELYKKGTELSADCKKILENAKLSITELTDMEKDND